MEENEGIQVRLQEVLHASVNMRDGDEKYSRTQQGVAWSTGCEVPLVSKCMVSPST